MTKKILQGAIALLTIFILYSATLAAPLNQGSTVCTQEIIVQADDWLSKIAEKSYGDVFAYPAIATATNSKNSVDNSFAYIEDANLIEIGWKLCIPSPDDAQAILDNLSTAPDVVITPPEPTGIKVGNLRLATTTSTYDSGLLTEIIPDFEARYSATVDIIAVGTGQAIKLGENGDVDVILVHARKREDAFVKDGFGINRQDVMYNDFVIIGPANDPAGIKGMTNASAALEKIAQTENFFISRGDDSGTNIREKTLWKATTIANDINNASQSSWYLSVGQGMGAVLTIADEKQAYTLSDRSTYLSRKINGKGLELDIMVEGDSHLFNPYGVIAVNPSKHTGLNSAGASAFIEWLSSLETQKLISQFGIDKFGMPLFTPDSAVWNAAK